MIEKQKKLKTSLIGGILWYINTTEYYAAIKKEMLEPHVMIWKDNPHILLMKKKKYQNNMYSRIPLPEEKLKQKHVYVYT